MTSVNAGRISQLSNPNTANHLTKRNKFSDESYQRAFLDKFAKTHNIAKQEDWYNIKAKDIAQYGGGLSWRIN